MFGGPRAVLLSDAFWSTRLGGDPACSARRLILNGQPTTIVGVLPPGFPFAPGAGARVVLAVQPRDDLAKRRNLNWLSTVARLRDGVHVCRPSSSSPPSPPRSASASLRRCRAWLTDVVPLRDVLVGRVEPVLVLLFACVSLVLLVACVNVANLLLARAAGATAGDLRPGRARGGARAASSASCSPRALLLAVPAACSGLLAARLASRCSWPASPQGSRPACPSSSTSTSTVGYSATAAGLVLLTTLLFGLLPALRASRPELHGALKDPRPAAPGPLRHGLRDAWWRWRSRWR